MNWLSNGGGEDGGNDSGGGADDSVGEHGEEGLAGNSVDEM